MVAETEGAIQHAEDILHKLFQVIPDSEIHSHSMLPSDWASNQSK